MTVSQSSLSHVAKFYFFFYFLFSFSINNAFSGKGFERQLGFKLKSNRTPIKKETG